MAARTTHAEAQTILGFWFEQLEPRQWWIKDLNLDRDIERRFGDTLERAIASQLSWRQDARGRLAEIIVLDQFSRNIYRGDPRAFAADPMALALAEELIAHGLDQELEPQQRAFGYMPFMHSESADVHRQAVPLFESLGMPRTLESEFQHKGIIDRFGRYPHRNAILGRASSPEELAFLQEPGSSF